MQPYISCLKQIIANLSFFFFDVAYFINGINGWRGVTVNCEEVFMDIQLIWSSTVLLFFNRQNMHPEARASAVCLRAMGLSSIWRWFIDEWTCMRLGGKRKLL